ncbi:MAG: hypothetical protein SF187_29265 [Deltaproteobacteria bacterium]|nr:hypothetical protein [Deltaproteobacteria bacterium]
MRHLRNQAQLCPRTLSLVFALYILLMFVGRVQSVSLVNFLTQLGSDAEPSTPASVAVFAEHDDDSDKKSFTNEWDEDDKCHSPLPLFAATYPDVSHRLQLHGPALVFASGSSRSFFCRGPPRA